MLFDSIQEIMTETNTTWNDIDFYSVGRGPGSFSGLRVAFAVATSLAMPDSKPVLAVSSGEAMARASLAEKTAHEKIAVIGDARRQMCWIGQFTRTGQLLEKTMDFKLIPYAEIGQKIDAETFVLTPDWERLEEKLQAQCPTATLNEGDVFPHASFVGIIALEHMARDGEGEELEPLYMHPPVFVEPKYV
jgi:tRNA threonylcarbamoyladenosine biosynthesis protein TsaB